MSSYAADFQDETGAVRLSGTLDFTDPDNQPAGVNQPFQPAPGGTVVIVEDSSGDDLLDFDETAGVMNVTVRTAFASRVGFYGTGPAAQPTVTGTLSAVLDANAQAVLTSIIAALVAVGLVTDGTT